MGAGDGDGVMAHPVEGEDLAVDLGPDPGMGVHHRAVLQVVHEALLCGEGRPELDLDPRPMGPVPLHLLPGDHLGLVGLDPDRELEPGGGILRVRPGDDEGRNPRGELGVEDRRRDPDPLLPPALLDLVEPGAVEELPEDEGDLGGDDPRAVVLNGHPEDLVGDPLHLDEDVGEDLGLLAGVEGVVHRLLHRGDDPPRGGIEAEEVLVLLEELGDADGPLLLREVLSEGQTSSPR
jgi:hypothetical protein